MYLRDAAVIDKENLLWFVDAKIMWRVDRLVLILLIGGDKAITCAGQMSSKFKVNITTR